MVIQAKYFAAGVLAAASVFASAQGGPPRPPSRGNGGGMPARQGQPQAIAVSTDTIRLLGFRTVQNELAMTVQQWAMLNNLDRSLRANNANEDAAFSAVGSVLNTPQMTRLKELLVQDLGYASLTLSSVRSKLSLTQDQNTEILTILESYEMARKAVIASATNAQAAETSVTKLRAEMGTTLSKLLTKEQDARLRALAG